MGQTAYLAETDSNGAPMDAVKPAAPGQGRIAEQIPPSRRSA